MPQCGKPALLRYYRSPMDQAARTPLAPSRSDRLRPLRYLVRGPLLLLNVLSKRDRVALKRLDGGDGSEESGFAGDCQALGCSWDQAVEALFRLSRNPNGIRRVCTASHLDDQRRRVCDTSEAVNENHVLIGYQDRIGGADEDGNG